MQTDGNVSPNRAAYLAERTRKTRFVRIMRYAILFLLLLFWEVGTRLNLLDPFITSSPSRVLATLYRLLLDGSLFLHIGVTLFETVAGFLVGTALGTMIAALLWWSETARRIFDPYLVVFNALPKIALGPILIVWIGAGMGSIIVMAVLVSLIVTVTSVLTGFSETSEEKKLLMKTLCAGKLAVFRLVVLPANVPTIISALKISVGMSWVGVIVGEYLVSQAGLGYLIVYGGQVFKLDLVMASIVTLCFLAALMYYAVAYLEKKLTR